MQSVNLVWFAVVSGDGDGSDAGSDGGVVRYGAAWSEVVWSGAVCFGVVWCGVMCCGVICEVRAGVVVSPITDKHPGTQVCKYRDAIVADQEF